MPPRLAGSPCARLPVIARCTPEQRRVSTFACRANRLVPTRRKHDIQTREVGGGRAPRQPGQVRKEAAATSFCSGRSSGLPPVHPLGRGPPRRLHPPRMSGLFQDESQLDTPPAPEGPGLFGDALEPTHAAPYRVLARKYRPTSFNDLIGQEAMVRILRNAFATGRVAHAFMLTGVR